MSLSDPPRVSICVPTYERSHLLRQALESALAQTFTDFELLVVDNASGDDTEAVVRSYTDSRIRYLRNPSNIGHRVNWNVCLKLARGRYINILPDDDAMLPDNLRRKLEIMERNPQVGLVHSKYHLIDANGRVTRENTNWGHGPERGGNVMEDRKFILTAPYNLINISAALFRRECYDRLGGFTEEVRYAWDWVFFMRIALYWDVYFLNEALVLWRIHSGSLTSINVNQEIAKLHENLGAKRAICESHVNGVRGGRALKKQMGLSIGAGVMRQTEAMLASGVPDTEVRAFLRNSHALFPHIFRDRRLRKLYWILSLKAALGRRRINALKRIAFLYPKRDNGDFRH
jgi:glycosyltransferase involved in cell wall biosynthesis